MDERVKLINIFQKLNSSVISKSANLKVEVTRKQSTPNFPKNEYFLPSDTHTYVCVSGERNVRFFGKFYLLCFLFISVLRFAFLSYYQQIDNYERRSKKTSSILLFGIFGYKRTSSILLRIFLEWLLSLFFQISVHEKIIIEFFWGQAGELHTWRNHTWSLKSFWMFVVLCNIGVTGFVYLLLVWHLWFHLDVQCSHRKGKASFFLEFLAKYIARNIH